MSPPESEIQAWLVSYLAQLLEVGPGEIDVDDTLQRHGLDSSGAIGMIGDLGNWLGRRLEPELIYNFPTVSTLARHLAEGKG